MTYRKKNVADKNMFKLCNCIRDSEKYLLYITKKIVHHTQKY